MKADTHPRQDERLAALRELEILDTPPELEFDEIARLASAICGTPISVINLIDEGRQWFKAEVGLGVRETPLDTSLCSHVILENDLTIVPDTLADDRFRDNPLCNGDMNLRFYAGAVLKTDDGLPIGTLCVLDKEPRDLTPVQQDALQVLARQVMARILLRRELARAGDMLREVDHRVKNSLSIIASILSMQVKASRSEDVKHAIELARNRVMAVSRVHDQLHHSGSIRDVDLKLFVERLADELVSQSMEEVELSVDCVPVRVSAKAAVDIGITLNELITNALRHGFDEGVSGQICITGVRNGESVTMAVENSGKPLPDGFDPSASKGLGMRVVMGTASSKGAGLKCGMTDDGRVRFSFDFTSSSLASGL